MEENKPRNNKPLLVEVWDYLKIRKKWWLLPIIIIILFTAVIITFGGGPLSPFVYALW